MADHAPFPGDSLHRVLAHLENERALHEEANDNRQFDAVYKHVGKLREWLSDVEELGDAVTIERAGISETADISETSAS